MKTLQDILSVPRFNDLTLVTPNVDLEIDVINVEITETPDISNYTSSGTLLLTTAMYYKDKPKEMIQLIDSLVTIQCPGLCIKTGRFLDIIPRDIIDYAISKNFPIIEIPITKPLGGILTEISHFIGESKEAEIAYALDIQRKFSSLLLSDASLDKITKEFGDVLQTPILLLNPLKEVIATSNNWDNKDMSTEHLMKELFSFENLFENKTHNILVTSLSHEQTEVDVYPIKSNTYYPYYLIILSPEKISYPVAEFIIEQGQMVLSFTLLKNDKLYEVDKHRKSDYLATIIERQEKNNFDEQQWITYEANFNLEISKFYQMISVSIIQDDTSVISNKILEEKQQIVYEWLDTNLPNILPKSVLFSDKSQHHCIILLQQPISSTALTKILTNVHDTIYEKLPIFTQFSCGQAYSHLDEISKSLTEAKIVEHDMLEQTKQKIVYMYKAKGMARLLDTIQKDEATYFAKDCLKSLYSPQTDMDLELRKTLKTFLDNQCEITKTANDLFIHRNTVKYRIDNIQEILGLEIDTPEHSFKLRLALELSEN